MKNANLTMEDIKAINSCPDSIGDDDKVNLLKQMMIWHLLNAEEKMKIAFNKFSNNIERDNYTQKIIMKYL